MNRRAFMTLIANQGVSDPYAGYNYYVDSVAGNDNNAGTSSLAPFATIAKLLTVWQAGQSVGLAKGSTWREQLTFPGIGSKAYAYGTGAKPILDASAIAVNASFTKTGGYTNIYQITVALPAGSTNFVNVWQDNVNMLRRTTLALVDANANSCAVTAETGSVTIYVHASDSSDVTANSKVYTYSARKYGAGSAYSDCWLEGVRTQKNLQADGSIIMFTSCTIKDCDAYYGSKHNVYTGDGSTLINVAAVEANYNSSATMFVINADAPAGLGVTVTNCSATQTQAFSPSGTLTGYHSHVNVSGGFGTITYTNCTATGMVGGFQGNHATNIHFVGCTTTGCTGNGYNIVDSPTIYNITNCTHVITASNTAQIVLGNTAFTGTLNISGCTFTADKPGQEGLVWIRAAATVNLTNNTFTITATANAYRIAVASSVACTVVGSGNHFVIADAVSDGYGYSLTNASANLTSDNNIFSHNAIQMNFRGNVYANLAAQQAQGFEVHSTVG